MRRQSKWLLLVLLGLVLMSACADVEEGGRLSNELAKRASCILFVCVCVWCALGSSVCETEVLMHIFASTGDVGDASDDLNDDVSEVCVCAPFLSSLLLVTCWLLVFGWKCFVLMF